MVVATRRVFFSVVLDSLQGKHFSEKFQKRVFATKSIQIGPKSISSMPPGLNFRKDLEFRIENNQAFQNWAQHCSKKKNKK